MLAPFDFSSDGLDRRRFLSLCAALAGTAAAPRLAAAATATATRSHRIEQLIARMTLEEKAGQLSCFTDVVRWSLTFINPTVNPADQE
jgi:beta-glucosidase